MKQQLIDDLINYKEKSNIKDLSVFKEGYIPPILKYRDKYVKILQGSLAMEVFQKVNFNIFGTTGCGKTITIRYCFKEAEDIWKQAGVNGRTLYVPCSDYDNKSKILSYMITSLGGEAPVKGWDKGTYLEMLRRRIEDEKITRLIVCLDEADLIISKGHWDLIFSLSNMSQIGLIFVSNIPDWNRYIDSRVRSRLQVEDIEFKSYTDDEIRGIIEQRIELGLKESVFREDVINRMIIKGYYNRGDLREVIKLLNVVIEEVRARNIPKKDIDAKLVDRCYFKLIERETLRVLDCLPPPQALMVIVIASLQLFKRDTDLTVKNINKEWNVIVSKSKKKIYDNIGERQTLNHLNSLELYRLINIVKKGVGRGKGVKNVVKPLFDVELAYDYLYEQKKDIKI